VAGQSHTPAVLPPGKGHDISCRGGWVSPMAGLDGRRNSSTWIRSRDHPARSKLLNSLRSLLKYFTICLCNEEQALSSFCGYDCMLFYERCR